VVPLGDVPRVDYLPCVASLETTSLTPDERQLLEAFAARLQDRLGASLHAVWLFGSRARGEPPRGPDSDVDLLVLVDDASWDGKVTVQFDLDDAAEELGLQDLTPWFAAHVDTPAWLKQRREIKSFFIAEIDRDKVVVIGEL